MMKQGSIQVPSKFLLKYPVLIVILNTMPGKSISCLGLYPINLVVKVEMKTLGYTLGYIDSQRKLASQNF